MTDLTSASRDELVAEVERLRLALHERQDIDTALRRTVADVLYDNRYRIARTFAESNDEDEHPGVHAAAENVAREIIAALRTARLTPEVLAAIRQEREDVSPTELGGMLQAAADKADEVIALIEEADRKEAEAPRE